MQQPKTIIVFEDDHDTLEVVKLILENEGIKVLSSAAKSSLQTVIDHQPHLVLLDHRLTDGMSDNFCLELKKHPQTAHIPVIIFSADNNVARIAHACNAEDFIAKPFDIDFLVNRIKIHLAVVKV
ncbi:hypothetical protein BH09BAC6_BH09BAC6_10560 [soil metagenome]